MKKLFLLASITFYISQAFAQIVTIPDVNFKAALVGNETINTNGDAEIQLTEAEAYNLSIEVSDLGITDLTGIEAFENITSLDCSNNAISNLDLIGNFGLIILQCQNNQLTSIDLSQNSSLNMMLCNANLLMNLDVTQNFELSLLSCDNNQLNSLDVSENTALNGLTCSNNNITNLDLTQNIALVELNVAINQLTSLDIRNGHNDDITEFISSLNPDLTCIFVDDATYATENWINVDATTTFVETEAVCESLSLGSFDTATVVLYPNPSLNFLNIEIDGVLKNALIYNIQGEKQLESTSKNINVSSLSPGYYIIKVENEVGKIAIKSFVKK